MFVCIDFTVIICVPVFFYVCIYDNNNLKTKLKIYSIFKNNGQKQEFYTKPVSDEIDFIFLCNSKTST